MGETQEENDLSAWLSTYGLITAERILERYKIRLQHEALFSAMKNPNSFYHRILRIPLKNVFNGIILQQAYDYQVYAQKIFIDYLMSGESSKPEEAPGGFTRTEIEKERTRLVGMADNYHECEAEHNKLIAVSQKILIDKAQDWLKVLSAATTQISLDLKAQSVNKNLDVIKNVINALLVHAEITDKTKISMRGTVWSRVEKIFGESLSTDLKQIFVNEMVKLKAFNMEIENFLSEFSVQANDIGRSLRGWRSDFYNLILRANDLLKQLPEYHADQTQTQENQESLYFDSDIGDER